MVILGGGGVLGCKGFLDILGWVSGVQFCGVLKGPMISE